MAEIITPTQAALAVWAGGAAWFALTLFRFMNAMIERDCVCTRSRLHHLSAVLSAAPALGHAALALTMVAGGLCWPVLIPYRAVTRRKRRNLPRCEHCGQPVQ